MLHGLLSTHETFLPLVEKLKPHFNLLLVDQRGHGMTPPEGVDYSAMTMALDLKNLLDQLQLKKITLLGHSMGARTALQFGQLYPEMIEKMILEDMGIEQRQERTPARDIEKTTIAQKAKVDSLFFKSKEEIYRIISPLFSYAKDLLTSKVVEHSSENFELKFWPDVSVLYGYQGNFTDLTPALTETHFPVMFLIADPAVGSAMTPQSIEHIKKNVPRAKLQYIPKAWHNIHKTHPAEFCDAVITFSR